VPAIPVIALSGRAAGEALFVVHDASHLGAVATLSKPLVAEEIIQTVRRVLGSRS
jgi:CheY-like chemotaxis protein